MPAFILRKMLALGGELGALNGGVGKCQAVASHFFKLVTDKTRGGKEAIMQILRFSSKRWSFMFAALRLAPC